jgi:hypothetical protein
MKNRSHQRIFAGACRHPGGLCRYRLKWLRRLDAGLDGHDAVDPGKRRFLGGSEFEDYRFTAVLRTDFLDALADRQVFRCFQV